jgi:hypothetical protein
MGGAAVPGELGGFTWRGMGSEAPWLVPVAGQAVQGPGPYAVSLAPPVLIERWTARWAPVVDGVADAVAGAERGSAGAVVLKGPNRPGTWSLQVDLRLASGDRCSYYWRLEVAP